MRTLVLVVILVLVIPASGQKAWKTFTGAWFAIDYPPEFTARASQASKSGKGAESAFFRSRDGNVEFYVFSPQWSGEARDIRPDTARETVSVKEQKNIDGAVGRLVTILAKDRSYMRVYVENEENGTKTITGMKCRDNNEYRKFKPVFERFRKTLRQFAD